MSGQNHLKVPIITYMMCVIQVNGAILTITQYPQYPKVSTTAYLTCHIPSFTGGAEWFRNVTSMTFCQASSCIPPSRPGYQYSADATTMNVTILSVDIALDVTTWTCIHNSGIDTGYHNLTIYTATDKPGDPLGPGVIAAIVIVTVIVGGCIIVIVVIVICYFRSEKLLCRCCNQKKCEECEASNGILICKCCSRKNCTKCEASNGILICNCCNSKESTECEPSDGILICKCCNEENCEKCEASNGIVICNCCSKGNCKGCKGSNGIPFCKCCNEGNCKKPVVVVAVLCFISCIKKKCHCQGNQEDESSSVPRNGRNINQQANSTARNTRTSNPQQDENTEMMNRNN